jgi:soluble P-type ATPase
MIRIEIPGTPALTLSHLVLDYNGTLAVNGILVDGVLERLDVLAQQLSVHVITADTYGTVAEQIAGKSIALHVIGADAQDSQKLAFVESLGNVRIRIQAEHLFATNLNSHSHAS